MIYFERDNFEREMLENLGRRKIASFSKTGNQYIILNEK